LEEEYKKADSLFLDSKPYFDPFFVCSPIPFELVKFFVLAIINIKINININTRQGISGGALVTSDGDVSGLVIVRENDIFAIPVDYINQKISSLAEAAVAKKESLKASAVESLGDNG